MHAPAQPCWHKTQPDSLQQTQCDSYVRRLNHTRRHSEIGMQPAAENEHAYSSQTIPAETARTQPKSQ